MVKLELSLSGVAVQCNQLVREGTVYTAAVLHSQLKLWLM